MSATVSPSAASSADPAPAPQREAERDDAGAFIGHAYLVGALTLVSRFAGLARDAVCARVFGAGAVWSSFAVAFLLPNLFRRLFGEGALSAAFIPIYAELRSTDAAQAQRFARATFTLTIAVLSAATLLGEALLALLYFATPLGDSGGLALLLAMALLPFMPMVCATALLGGALQTHAIFAPTAAAPIILNLCIIAAAVSAGPALGLAPERAIFAVAFAVLVAGMLQLAWSALALQRCAAAGLWTRAFAPVRQPMRRLLTTAGPAALGLGVFQLNTLLDGLIASWPVLVGDSLLLPGLGRVAYPLDDASNAVLFYANRLHHFPLGVFGVSLATAVFPALSRLAGREDAFRQTLSRGVRLALFLGIPAAVGLALVREPLAGVIFAGGRFDAAALDRVADAVLGYAPALASAMVAQTLMRAYYAKGKTRAPMRIALVAVGVNLALNLALIWPLREAGLAWATSAAAFVQVALLAALLPRATGSSALDIDAAKAAGLTCAAALVMAPGVLAAMRLTAWALPEALAPEAWISRLATLLTGVGAGAAIFGGVALLARMEELRWLFRRSVNQSEPRA